MRPLPLIAIDTLVVRSQPVCNSVSSLNNGVVNLPFNGDQFVLSLQKTGTYGGVRQEEKDGNREGNRDQSEEEEYDLEVC